MRARTMSHVYATTSTLATVVVCVLTLLESHQASALDNGLAKTPPMAYSTWNYFNTAVNETLLQQIGDALVSTGLADLGYNQVNIDAGYLEHERHPMTNSLQVNKTLFPNGMRAVADYLNARGLKLGVYTDIGNGSCGHGPGSYGFYDVDAQTFADWHVDYLKVDFCGFGGNITFADWVDPGKQLAHWEDLRDALNRTNRPIYFSICPHGHVLPTGPSEPWWKNGTGYAYAPPLVWTAKQRMGVANSLLVEYTNLFDFWYAEHWEDFRTCGPTPQCPDCKHTATCHKSGPGGLLTDVDAMVQLTKPEYSGAGSWADGDMLQVCNYGKGGPDAGGRNDGGMTLEEYKASYSIWAVLASPMIISADVRTLAQEHPECLAMLKNKQVIAISQDPLAKAGAMIRQETNCSNKSMVRVDNIVEQVFSRDIVTPANDSDVDGDDRGTRLQSDNVDVDVDVGGDVKVGGYDVDGVDGRVTRSRSRAVVLFNRGETPRTISVTWDELGLSNTSSYVVHDVWATNNNNNDNNNDDKNNNNNNNNTSNNNNTNNIDDAENIRGQFVRGYSALVSKHSVVMVIVTPAKSAV